QRRHTGGAGGRSARPRPCALGVRRALSARGEGGRDALLRRARARGDRGLPRRLADHRQARLELRARLAAQPAGRVAMSEERLQELYHRALELDEAGRRRLLVDLTLEAPELAAELARLLLVPAAAPSPIDGSPWRAAAPDADEEAAASAPA